MKFRKILLGASALLLAASSQATVLAYDDFAIEGGLDGSNGGGGFTNAWSGGTYTIAGGVVSSVAASEASYRSLASAPGSNGTIWVSFDMERTSGDSYGGLSLFEPNGTNAPIERLIIGDRFKAGVWCLDHAGTAYTTVPIDGGIKKAVAKITLGSGSTSIVELWVGTNNTDIVDCSGIADATVTSGNLENANILRFGAGFYMDFADLIIADTAAEVGASIGNTTVFTASGLWTNAVNWSAGVPTATDDATIDTGADVTLDAAGSVQSLSVKTSASLTVVDGAALTAGSDVLFAGSTTLTVGIGAGTSGTLAVGGMLDIDDAALTVDGNMDGTERIIATTTGGLVGEFSNYADAAFVQNSGDYSYYIHYVTNVAPNYITINTNGLQSGGGEVALPPRPAEQLIVDGFDQRYMAYDYDVSSGVWMDMVSSAQNATAVNIPDFSVSTNAPNGRPAVVNSGVLGEGTKMSFTRDTALAGQGYTVQAVIRIDAGNGDNRQGPFALADGGWSGLFMGARDGTEGDVKIRGGRQVDDVVTGAGDQALRIEGQTMADVSAGMWGIYTLIFDAQATDTLTATFDLLSDGSTVFSAVEQNGITNDVSGINTAGRLFGGELGGAANTTDNWMGAIADVVVYNMALTSDQLATNEAAFQTIYQDDIVFSSTVGDLSIETVPAGAVVSWATVSGGDYTLKAADSLTTPTWTPVATGVEGTGSDVSVTNSTSGPQKFYKAEGYDVIWGD